MQFIKEKNVIAVCNTSNFLKLYFDYNNWQVQKMKSNTQPFFTLTKKDIPNSTFKIY